MSPRVGAWLLAAAFAMAVADSVYQIPIQVSDSLDVIIEAAETPTAAALFAAAVEGSKTTLRPLRYNQAQWLAWAADRTGTSYHAWFRGSHAAFAAALLLLFAGILPVRDWLDLAALAAALVVAAGHHTFVSMLREAYPVNHYAQVTLCAMVVYALARRPHARATDAAIAVILLYQLLLIESGILLWVLVMAAFALRMPGIRRSTVAATTLVVLAWGVARLSLGIIAPPIGGQGSGWGGTYYSETALHDMFGDRSFVFAAYNMAGTVLSVLFSEPRQGVFFTLADALQPVTIVNIAASLATTALVGWYVGRRLPRDRARWNEGDRLVLIALTMIVATAPLTTSYMKDEILAIGGMFYAAAVFVALRALFDRARTLPAAATLALALAFAAGGTLWAFRAGGVHYILRATAVTTRHDWSEDVRPAQFPAWSRTAAGTRVLAQLREEVLLRRVAGEHQLPGWGERYWGE